MNLRLYKVYRRIVEIKRVVLRDDFKRLDIYLIMRKIFVGDIKEDI